MYSVSVYVCNSLNVSYAVFFLHSTHTDTVYDELTEVCFEIDWFSLPARLIPKSDQDDLPINAACYIKTAFYNNGGYKLYLFPVTSVSLLWRI